MAKKKSVKSPRNTRRITKKPRKTSVRKNITATSIKIEPVTKRLNPFALGYAFGIIRVLVVLLVSVLAKFGKATDFLNILQKVHFFYSLTPRGIIAGLAETAIWGLLMGFVLGWVYNKFA